jgi:hypothetical protein
MSTTPVTETLTSYWRSLEEGGTGGRPFHDNLTEATRVVAVRVWHGRVIDAVQFVWEDRYGLDIIGPRHGGDGGELFELRIDRGDFITSIEGRRDRVITQLRFVLNEAPSPFIGSYVGIPFPAIRPKRGERPVVGGLFGRSATYLDAIGAFFPAK